MHIQTSVYKDSGFIPYILKAYYVEYFLTKYCIIHQCIKSVQGNFVLLTEQAVVKLDTIENLQARSQGWGHFFYSPTPNWEGSTFSIK